MPSPRPRLASPSVAAQGLKYRPRWCRSTTERASSDRTTPAMAHTVTSGPVSVNRAWGQGRSGTRPAGSRPFSVSAGNPTGRRSRRRPLVSRIVLTSRSRSTYRYVVVLQVVELAHVVAQALIRKEPPVLYLDVERAANRGSSSPRSRVHAAPARPEPNRTMYARTAESDVSLRRRASSNAISNASRSSACASEKSVASTPVTMMPR